MLDAQTLFTSVQGTVAGRPALRAAWLAGACKDDNDHRQVCDPAQPILTGLQRLASHQDMQKRQTWDGNAFKGPALALEL